jgi:hypothetical protein
MYLDILFRIIGYVLVVTGLWLIVGQPLLASEFKRVTRRLKRKRDIRLANKVEKRSREKNRLYQHIYYMMLSLNKTTKSVNNFFFISVAIFVLSFSVIYLSISEIVTTLVLSTVLTIIPYSILRFSLAKLRMRLQLVFLNDFHLVLQAYQITNKDIYYALLNVSKETQDKKMKQTYMNLLSAMQKERNEERLREAVHVFIYAVNSSFSRRLGKLITKAYIDHVDISAGLNDISVDVKKRKIDMEKEKSSSLEAILVGYIPLVLMPLVIFCAYRTSGVVKFDTLFFQKLPFATFIVATIFTVFSVMLSYIFSKPKADI